MAGMRDLWQFPDKIASPKVHGQCGGRHRRRQKSLNGMWDDVARERGQSFNA